ncbi:imidazolonepropionase-like domain-containing protein [Streptomyces bottropensis]|uniref:imidazolonepropionase-like domain-containing protein n=1 Tax=Streptomyces bottropensis TaxID=42235 RepID=UPI0036BC44B4
MLTIHAADEVRRTWDDPEPIKDGAVVVDGIRIEAVGPAEDLRQRFPAARVRQWPGVLGPGRVHEDPLPDAPSPRERVHAVLKSGATAVLEQHAGTPELRSAAERNHVRVLPRPHSPAIVELGRADLVVLDDSGSCLATVCAGRLVHRRR